ncbi:UDP-glucose 4-epimerase GalE [Polynucleobacter sp. VK25]|uniref:UDP-glucose 4-epimerase GalE n=1 Tax=Polynucleobacter sp. VK25 TaxID=1758398 RepID=UPI001BFD04B8|nr:UDP-glucose 4-epimerase GalE [Polynucleobacter sp. VK25]QWD68639.1 UDP-glucose 4-epimerase GalE [Polynucleobacter sp. VK25]
MNILLTGGAGYIGSHAAVVLSQAGHEVVLLDNFCNSRKSILERLQKILGKALPCIEGDVRDTALVTKTLQDCKIDAVIHFAGLKAVGESVKKPTFYYANNVQGSISLLQAMQTSGVRKIIFSSSATVYGVPIYLPYDENHPTNPINPYGNSKLQVEIILRDLANSDPEWRIACLRYFNPIGAHFSGAIGDNPSGEPGNLMPYITRVAAGKLEKLSIFGRDYDTRDGTGERDYIHVMDLVEGHAAALNFLENNSGCHTINLGTGKSASVMECVSAFEKVTGISLPINYIERRSGDLPIYYASAELALQKLGWYARRSLEEMCESAWDFENSCQAVSRLD